MSRLLLATRNEGKIRELRALLSVAGVTLETFEAHPEIGETAETGKTFEENARLKASESARQGECWALGEDSGLEVDALGGAPGVGSARFSGEHGDDAANNGKLLHELRGESRRTARYVCVMVLANPKGEIVATTRGACEGVIREEPSGSGGFGYDPLFSPERKVVSMAELTPEEKEALSHRGRAARAMLPLLVMHLC